MVEREQAEQAEQVGESMVLYDIEEIPPRNEALILSLQHALTLYAQNLPVPLIFATTLGLATGQVAFLVQMATFVAGVSTIVQAYGFGPVGGRVPIVMGTSFVFLGPLIVIGEQFSLAVVFGATFVAAVVEFIIGFWYDRARELFPPLVTGIVIMLIGITLMPTSLDYAAGGVSAPDYGAINNLGVAAFVILITVFLGQLTAFTRAAAILGGLIAGYILAIPLGMVDFSPIAEEAWISLPMPLQFGLEFEPAAILIVGFLYLISSIETIGDITGVVGATGRKPTTHQIRGGLFADGASSSFAALFGVLPMTSYSGNVGLVNFTGVASRHIVAICGGMLVLLGFVPKLGGLVATIPQPVLGGAVLVMFSMVFSTGVKIVAESIEFNHRNLTVVAVSMGVGIGIAFRPEVVANAPEPWDAVLGSGLLMGGLVALSLHQILPEELLWGSRIGEDSDISVPADAKGED